MKKEFKVFASIVENDILKIFKSTDNRNYFFTRINLTTYDNYEDTRTLEEVILGKVNFTDKNGKVTSRYYSNNRKQLRFWKENLIQCKCCGRFRYGKAISISKKYVQSISTESFK